MLTLPVPKRIRAEDDRFASVLELTDAPCREADAGDGPLDLPPDSEQEGASRDRREDNPTAYYFGEVRRFPLLKHTEEQALWAEIERRKAQVRRTLSTSPVALTTLTRVCQHIAQREVPLSQVFRAVGDEQNHPKMAATLAETLTALQGLHAGLCKLADTRRAYTWSADARRACRQDLAQLWQTWIATWEALELHPQVYETLRCDLDAALQGHPDNPALRAAHAGWLRAQRQLTTAKDRMLQANLRLVIYVAKSYRGRGVPLLDLIQEGNLGLMRALEKFEPRRGVKFSTYAHWWVRQSISRAVMEQNRTVRLPTYVIERRNKLRTAAERLWDTSHHEPTVQELSMALDWTPQEVLELQVVAQPMVRLHTPLVQDGRVLADVLEDTQALPPEEQHAEAELRHVLADCLADLTAREGVVLRRRFGLEGDHAQNLQEIADVLGLSRERVRQIEHQALAKLRTSRGTALLAEFVER